MSPLNLFVACAMAVAAVEALISATIWAAKRARGTVSVYPDSWTAIDRSWLQRARIVSGVGSAAAITLSAIVAIRLGTRGALDWNNGWSALFLPLMIVSQWIDLSAPRDWSERKLVSPRTAAMLMMLLAAAATFYYLAFFAMDALAR